MSNVLEPQNSHQLEIMFSLIYRAGNIIELNIPSYALSDHFQVVITRKVIIILSQCPTITILFIDQLNTLVK